jgi:ABC-type transporter Mla subunit MlaD
MRGRGPIQSLAASPTMVGAITTLIVIVAVFLAYNANQGLPFVPVYRVSVEVPNAARLVNNNEVRIGGNRVGVVESIEAVPPTGEEEAQPVSEGAATDQERSGGASPNDTIAQLNLKLDQRAEPIPQDSVFRVRYRSSFGLKYLEITRGDGEPAPEGFVFDNPENFIEQTEFDDIANTFDSETRENNRTNLVGFGDAFAGRGLSLNLAIEELDPLFRNLRPVAQTLAANDTRLDRFFSELGDNARIVAPVAEEQAQLFTNMAITFAAISSDVAALQETISEGPPTLETGIELLPRQRPFLRDFTTLSRELRPGISDLRPTLPVLNEAIKVGTPVLRHSVATNRKLRGVLRELNRLVRQPQTKIALTRLGETFDEARSFFSYFRPYQTRCNLWNLNFYALWEHISQRDDIGFLERVYPVTFPEGQQGSPGGYTGITANGRDQLTGVFEPDKYVVFHDDPYDVAVDEQGRTDCQATQGGYSLGQDLVPGQSPSDPSLLTSDSPVLSGPTFGGEARK